MTLKGMATVELFTIYRTLQNVLTCDIANHARFATILLIITVLMRVFI